jgi:hypothetical protein
LRAFADSLAFNSAARSCFSCDRTDRMPVAFDAVAFAFFGAGAESAVNASPV